MQTEIVKEKLVIHISTPGGKVEKLSTKIRMWKSGKLPIRVKFLKTAVENSNSLKITYQIKVNYFIIVSTNSR